MSDLARARWGDNDTYLGPFTFARDSKSYRPLAAVLSSADDDGRVCNLRLSGFGFTALVALPDIIKPARKKVFPQSWDAATIARLGRNWYWDITKREYGFSYSEGYLSVSYGRVTHASDTEQRFGWFAPWTQWRHVRHSLYDLKGAHWHTQPEEPSRLTGKRNHWDIGHILKEACPAATFAFKDFDGEALTATTRIEEREWLFGDRGFKWLSLFAKPKVRRSLDIEFSGETGKRKGSWKGGTLGTGIDMLPSVGRHGEGAELHESAFRRYCAEHAMTFVSRHFEATTGSAQKSGATALEPTPPTGRAGA